jgi:hypothetical protein
MLVNGVSEIHTPHGQVLYGEYVRGMPVFALDDVLALARQQTTASINMVATSATARRLDDRAGRGGEQQ